MPTVLDAIQAGDEGLAIVCRQCRVIFTRSWAKLPALRLGDPIESLKDRLKCERCSMRPASVEATRPGKGYDAAPLRGL